MRESSETRFSVKIYPNAQKNEVVDLWNGVVRIRVSAPPEKGKANKELIDFLHQKLDISKDRIIIIRGETSRNKIISVTGLEIDQVMARLLPRLL